MARDPAFRFKWERAIRADRDLKPTTRLVLFVIGTYMDNDGTNARMSYRTLADSAGIAKRTAMDHVGIAIESGWLAQTQKGRKVGSGENAYSVPSNYTALLPRGCSETTPSEPEAESPRVSSDTPEGAVSHARGCREDHPTGSDTRGQAAAGAAADESSHTPSDALRDERIDLEVRRRVRAFEERTGEVAGPGMRQVIREEVERDFELDQHLEDNPTAGYKLEAKIAAARKWAERIAKQGYTRTQFYDLLHRQSDWAEHGEVTDAAFLSFAANEYGRVV